MDRPLRLVVCGYPTSILTCSLVHKREFENYKCVGTLPDGNFKVSFDSDCFCDEITRNELLKSINSCKVKEVDR